MIPSIEDIIDGLLAGTITKPQAYGWLNQHAEDGVRWLRDDFAAAALGIARYDEPDGADLGERVAERAYEIADKMLKARKWPPQGAGRGVAGGVGVFQDYAACGGLPGR